MDTLNPAHLSLLDRTMANASVDRDIQALEDGPFRDFVQQLSGLSLQSRFQYMMLNVENATGVDALEVLEALQNNVGRTEADVSYSYPWPVLSHDAFVGTAGDIVKAIAPHTEADTIALLMDLLVSFGVLLDRHVYFYAGGQRHGMNLFTCIVGDTRKGKKGTAQRMVNPIFERFDPLWEERVHTGLSTGEGLVSLVRDRRERASRAKGEDSVVVEDEGARVKQIMVIEEEFDGLLEVAHREGNTLTANLRKAWDHAILEVVTRGAPLRATGAHIAIQGQITPTALRSKLTKEDAANGFGNRFLWIMSRASKSIAIARSRPDYDHLADVVQECFKWSNMQGERRYDSQATLFYTRIYPKLDEELPGIVGGMSSRSASQICRIAALFSCFDKSPFIRLEHLTAAVALVKYCIDTLFYLFGDKTGVDATDDLVQFLRENPAGVLRREIGTVVPSLKREQSLIHTLEDIKKFRLAAATDEGTKREIWRPLPVGPFDFHLNGSLEEARRVRLA